MDRVWFLSIKHRIVPCFVSRLKDILVTGNVADEDTAFLRGIIHNQSFVFTRSAGEPLALLSLYSKGSAARCCFWHFSQWKPTVCMLTEYLPSEESTPLQVQKDYFIPSSGFGWQARNQSHSVLMGGCFRRSESYTFVSGSLCAVAPFLDHIKAKLGLDTVWYGSSVYRKLAVNWFYWVIDGIPQTNP